MSQLQHSMFHSVFFPKANEAQNQASQDLLLQKVLRYRPSFSQPVKNCQMVVFDFETTGLNSDSDVIIEIGGLKIKDGKGIAEFSTLIDPKTPISETVTKITGINQDMLDGQPTIEDQLPKFLDFIQDSILVAHNAEFDMAFLRNACLRMGYEINWPCFCTLKLARELLPNLESKNLDTLAQHYQLTFEARHRSIGDCKVTSAVLQSFLTNEGAHLNNWPDFRPFTVGT